MRDQEGSANPNWKGGRRVHKQSGRWTIIRNGRHVLEHRVIVEELLGRVLEPDEVVHHINGNFLDNSPENLQVMKRGDHIALHNKLNPRHINRQRDSLGRLI